MAAKAAFIQARAEGKPLRVIAEELHTAKRTLCKWDKELAEEVRTRRGEELEAILDGYALYRGARLRRLGEVLARLDQELERRDLGELPTAGLLYLRLQYGQEAAKEAAALEPEPQELKPAEPKRKTLPELFRELDEKRAAEKRAAKEAEERAAKPSGGIAALLTAGEGAE